MRQTMPTTAELKTIAELIATKFSFRRLPEIRLTEATVSPMVWPAAYPPLVVLPQQLVDGMNRSQLVTIVAHEFAHLRRADHWVRFLEVVVISLYWWNPIIWWVCRELRAAEEACCDALVLHIFPDQLADYGEALLRTNEFIMSGQIPSPVLASGFGHSCSLKRRVEMILKNEFGKPASPIVKILILAIAFGVLPMAATIVLAQKDETPTDLDTFSASVFDTNIEADKVEELEGVKSVTVKVKPVGKKGKIDSNVGTLLNPQEIQGKSSRPTIINDKVDVLEARVPDGGTSLLVVTPKKEGSIQSPQNNSNSLEKRVDRMESLLKQLLAAQTSKKVSVQAQVSGMSHYGDPASYGNSAVRRGLTVTLPSVGPPPMQQAYPSYTTSRHSKKIQWFGDPVVIERIVQHLQYEKGGRDLILKKQAEIERLSNEVEQLKAAFKQIELLKAALKKAEDAKVKGDKNFNRS